MTHRTSLVGTLLVSFLVAVPAAAAPDHLKCYKMKDSQAKLSYMATLDGLTPEAGCKIAVPGKLLCVPAVKSAVTPTPPGGGAPGVPNPFVCYKVKCPAASNTLHVRDQFGDRTVATGTAKLLCAPGVPLTTTTTTTTTTNTTGGSCTTTTLFPCGPGHFGPCPGAQQCIPDGQGGGTCNGPPVACADASGYPVCGLAVCPPGQQCVTVFPAPQFCSSHCECQ